MRKVLLVMCNVLLFTAFALSQVAVAPYLSPHVQFATSAGRPLAGGKIYFYVANTDTPLSTYTSSTGVTANANPVVLDSGGFANIWLGPYSYKIVAKDSTDVTQWTVDNVLSLAAVPHSNTSNTYTAANVFEGAVTTQSLNGVQVVGVGSNATIQDAVDAVPAGGTVFIPAGTYDLDTTGVVVATDDVQILCDGKARITYSGSGSAFQFSQSGVTQTNRPRFKNCYVDGAGSSAAIGLELVRTMRAEVDGNYFTDFATGIYVDGSDNFSALGTFSGNTVRNCTTAALKFGGNGVGGQGGKANNMAVHHNDLHCNATGDSIQVDGGGQISIYGRNLLEGGTNGLHVKGSASEVVSYDSDFEALTNGSLIDSGSLRTVIQNSDYYTVTTDLNDSGTDTQICDVNGTNTVPCNFSRPHRWTLGGGVFQIDNNGNNPVARFYRPTGAGSNYYPFAIEEDSTGNLLFRAGSFALLGSESLSTFATLTPAGNFNAVGGLKTNGVTVKGVFSGVSGSLGGGALLAGACSSINVTISGVTAGMTGTAQANDGSDQDNYVIKAYGSAPDTATVKVCAITNGTPTAKTYEVRIYQ